MVELCPCPVVIPPLFDWLVQFGSSPCRATINGNIHSLDFSATTRPRDSLYSDCFSIPTSKYGVLRRIANNRLHWHHLRDRSLIQSLRGPSGKILLEVDIGSEMTVRLLLPALVGFLVRKNHLVNPLTLTTSSMTGQYHTTWISVVSG